jgi:hypothetical protein
MGKTCPCGCGRKVKLGLLGVANAYVRVLNDMDLARPAFAWAVDREAPEDPNWPETKRRIVALRESGEHLEGWLLARIHGTARPGTTPSHVELHQQVKQYEKGARTLMALWVRDGGSSTAA